MENWQIALIIVGGGLLLGGTFLSIGLSIWRKSRDWEPTTGIIVQKNRFFEGMPDRHPTVAFRTAYGEEFEATSSISQSPGIKPGKIVDVLYDPDNPRRAVINNFIHRGTIFSIIGLFIICVTSFAAFLVYSILSIG